MSGHQHDDKIAKVLNSLKLMSVPVGADDKSMGGTFNVSIGAPNGVLHLIPHINQPTDDLQSFELTDVGSNQIATEGQVDS